MKPVTKSHNPGILSNPITRNLVLILVLTLVFAVVIVTTAIIIYNQL